MSLFASNDVFDVGRVGLEVSVAFFFDILESFG